MSTKIEVHFYHFLIKLTNEPDLFNEFVKNKEPDWRKLFLISFYSCNKQSCEFLLSRNNIDLHFLLNECIDLPHYPGIVMSPEMTNRFIKSYMENPQFLVECDNGAAYCHLHLLADVDNCFDLNSKNRIPFIHWIVWQLYKQNIHKGINKRLLDSIKQNESPFYYFIHIIYKIIDSPLFDINIFVICVKQFIFL